MNSPFLLTGLLELFCLCKKKRTIRVVVPLASLPCIHDTLVHIYGLIPYKTPWLALNFLLGFALLGGHIDDRLLKVVRFNDARLIISLLMAWSLFAAPGQARKATGVLLLCRRHAQPLYLLRSYYR